MWWDTNGDENEVLIESSNAKTLSSLETSIEANAGWDMSINYGYENYPTLLLQPILNEQATNQRTIYPNE